VQIKRNRSEEKRREEEKKRRKSRGEEKRVKSYKTSVMFLRLPLRPSPHPMLFLLQSVLRSK
jgi:hypothetical protein